MLTSTGTSGNDVSSSFVLEPEAARSTMHSESAAVAASRERISHHSNNKSSSKGVNVSHLVNFKHYETPRNNNASSSSNSMSRPYSRQQYQSLRNNRNTRSNSFYLQSSSQHAFVLRRQYLIPGNTIHCSSNNATTSSPRCLLSSTTWNNNPDTTTSLPWEAIEIVKVFVDVQQQQQQECCPICLEEFYRVPRCFPCGHLFCLACILQYSSYYTTTTTTTGTTIKCPCCSKFVSIPQDLRSVQFVTVSSPVIHSQMTFRKMYRIKSNTSTTIVVPSSLATACSTTNNDLPPNLSDNNSIFYRFNLQDATPHMYMQQLTSDSLTVTNALRQAQDKNSCFSFLKMAQHLVQHELHSIQQRDHHPKEDVQQKEERRMPLSSITNDSDDCTNSQAFYQAADGQLCFLSGFNMVCLDYEYSRSSGSSSSSSTELLPSVVEGRVRTIETVQITHDVRKRYPFLQHLPLYLQVTLVEVHLSCLSEETKCYFKKDFNKRNKKQREEKKKEKSTNNNKNLKHHQQQQQQQLGDFVVGNNDNVFSSPFSEDFGPSLLYASTTTTTTTTAEEEAVAVAKVTLPFSPQQNDQDSNKYYSFKAVVAGGGVWPGLSESTMVSSSYYSPGQKSSQSCHTTNKKEDAIKQQQDLTPCSSCLPRNKQKKEKKVLLFSTGGHRGSG